MRLYHASPQLNIHRFHGKWHRLFQEKGIFVGPKSAIINSWAIYVFGKKNSDNYNVHYGKVAVYELSLRRKVFEKIKEHNLCTIKNLAGEKNIYGFWYWDVQWFIPESFFGDVRISGKEIWGYHELLDIMDNYDHRDFDACWRKPNPDYAQNR